MQNDEIVKIIKEKNAELSKSAGKTIAVTKCIEYCHKGFDKEGTAQKCFEKGYNDPESKYYQMDVNAILESWLQKGKDACHYGSMLDDYIGMVLNEETDKLEEWKLNNNYDYDLRIHNLCDGFDQLYKNLYEKTDYRYVTREQKMYIKSNKTNEYINGRFDCLFYSESLNRFLIIDWKSSGTIDKANKWEKMLGPLYDKDACNLNEYTIQVQMYKKALCETYKLAEENNIDTYICQFCQETNEYGNKYMIHKPSFDYNSQLLDNIIEFSYKKKVLNESKKENH